MSGRGDIDRGALTILTRIKDDEIAPLRDLLEGIGTGVANNPHIRFSSLATTHFLRWVILEDKDKKYPDQLAFESNYDGTLGEHLDELVRVGRAALDLIYGHCEDYPPEGERTIESITTYLNDHAIPYAAFYRGYPGKRLSEIRRNTRLFDLLQSFLRTPGLRVLSPSSIRQELLSYVANEDVLEAPTPSPPRSLLTRWLGTLFRVPWLYVAPVVVLALVLSPLILPLLIVLLVKEHRDQSEHKATDEVPTEVVQKENHMAQNQLTHLVELKPGPFRRGLLRAVLWTIDLLARAHYINGSLGGISSIHCARWVFIDDARRLLFFSNYDGSWERYLGDFIDLAQRGLTGVWSNTRGFPRTRFLVCGGATDEEEFKQWARNRQVPTQVWYTAHANESVGNILDNAVIRAELQQPVCGPALLRWIRKL